MGFAEPAQAWGRLCPWGDAVGLWGEVHKRLQHLPWCKVGMEGMVGGSIQARHSAAVALDGLQSLWATQGLDNAPVIPPGIPHPHDPIRMPWSCSCSKGLTDAG